jgi:hypothetical protein
MKARTQLLFLSSSLPEQILYLRSIIHFNGNFLVYGNNLMDVPLKVNCFLFNRSRQLLTGLLYILNMCDEVEDETTCDEKVRTYLNT